MSAAPGQTTSSPVAGITARPPTVDQALASRISYTEWLLACKESLVLKYVSKKLPRPYYVNWVADSNELFTLASSLSRRRRRLARKAAS